MVNNLSPKDAREGEEDASSNLMDAAKKLKQVQCVVELKYRHLLTTRAMRSVNHSLKGNEIRSLESKLYKLFAKQLEVKHRALENVKTREDRIAMEKELDGFLNTRIFLGVSGINILDVEKILDFRPEMTVDGLFLASAPLFKSILLNLGIHPESQDKLAISMRALKDAYEMALQCPDQHRLYSDSTHFLPYTPPSTPTLIAYPSVQNGCTAAVSNNFDFVASSPYPNSESDGEVFEGNETLMISREMESVTVKEDRKCLYSSSSVGSHDIVIDPTLRKINNSRPKLKPLPIRQDAMSWDVPCHFPNSVTDEVPSPAFSNGEAFKEDFLTSLEGGGLSLTSSGPSNAQISSSQHELHRCTSLSFSVSCTLCKKSLYLRSVQCKTCKLQFHKSCAKKLKSGDCQAHSEYRHKNTGQSDRNHKHPKYVSATKTLFHQQSLPSPSVSSSHSSTPSPATPISPHTTQAFFSTVQGDDSSEQEVESQDGITQLSLAHTGKFSSVDDITDLSPTSQRGRRPHPQIVPIGSLPDLHKPKRVSSTRHSTLQDPLHTSDTVNTIDTLTFGSSEAITSRTTLVTLGDCDSQLCLVDQGALDVALQNKEWEIPLEELKLNKLLEQSPCARTQTWRGYWHGEVLVKKIHVPNATKRQMEKFTHDVAALKHSRHENVVLFMGVCSKPPDLAVVTSDIKGDSLYSRIHIRPETFNSRRVHTIIKQVAQGMGYLRARNIVHKDLTSRNIFCDEKDKVVITDVGFNSVTDCQLLIGGQQDRLVVPRGWLNYVAPEILQVLSPVPSNSECMDCYPYTFQSDIYAFGVVWYELVTGKWPFEGYEPEQVIYMVGNGLKPRRNDIPGSTKGLLYSCFNFNPKTRPSFQRILGELVHSTLSRSLECIAK